MKQLVLMIALTLAGTLGTFTVNPFLGVAIYYLFSVLRPQFLWYWALPPGISWSFYVALAALVAAVTGMGGTARSMASDGPRFTSAHRAILAFGIWVGVSYALARDREVAQPWALDYAKIFLMIAASTVLIRTVGQLWALFAIAAFSLGYIAYEINYLYFAYHYLGMFQNGYGGLDNNILGLALAMGVVLCYFGWECQTGWSRWCFLSLVPVLLHAVLMSYSRGAMVSLVLVAPLVWLRSRHRVILTLAGVAMAFLLPILAGPEIRTRFFSVSDYQRDDSAQSRLSSWKAAWDITRDNPVFGVGVRNSNLLSYQYGADMEGRTIHNTYLQTAADMGLVGLGLYLTALGATWHSLNKARRAVADKRDMESRRAYGIAAGVECALAVFCVGGMFLSLDVFELPYLLLLIGAQLAPLVCASVTIPAVPRTTRLAPRSAYAT